MGLLGSPKCLKPVIPTFTWSWGAHAAGGSLANAAAAPAQAGAGAAGAAAGGAGRAQAHGLPRLALRRAGRDLARGRGRGRPGGRAGPHLQRGQRGHRGRRCAAGVVRPRGGCGAAPLACEQGAGPCTRRCLCEQASMHALHSHIMSSEHWVRRDRTPAASAACEWRFRCLQQLGFVCVLRGENGVYGATGRLTRPPRRQARSA